MKKKEQRNELDTSFLEIIFHLKNDINTMYGIGEYKNEEIVPQQLTHYNLIKNNTIADSILDYYYSPTSRWIEDKAWEAIIDSGYYGIRKRAFDPYAFKKFGAFHYRNDLLTKLCTKGWTGKMPFINKNQEINTFSDLSPYFKEYANGFKEGFDNFEKNCITPFLPMFSDKDDYSLKVFDFLTKKVLFEHDWTNNHSGFATKDSIISLVESKLHGKKQGEFYRAWSIVFSNNYLFKHLFTEIVSSSQQNEALPPPPISIEIKPTIDSDAANQFFNILKGYFEPKQHTELQTILEKGINVNQKLIFKGNANQLTDAFKKLYHARLLTGCQKKDLQKWIVDNFQFFNKKKGAVDFKAKTVEKSIAGNEYRCENPIIKITNGVIERA